MSGGLSAALERVGDRWSLLVVGALLDGPLRFNQLQQAVPGLAPNVLSSRLRRLERDGVVVAAAYSDRPARFEYSLSQEGRGLAGVVRMLAGWGARTSGIEAAVPRHHLCGAALEAHWYCPTCQQVLADDYDALDWL
jgi:DNA-binding HxlR family transcriptional regulator